MYCIVVVDEVVGNCGSRFMFDNVLICVVAAVM